MNLNHLPLEQSIKARDELGCGESENDKLL